MLRILSTKFAERMLLRHLALLHKMESKRQNLSSCTSGKDACSGL